MKPPERATDSGCREVTPSTTKCSMWSQAKRSTSLSNLTLPMRQSEIGQLSLGVNMVQLLLSTLMVFNQTLCPTSKSSRTRLQSTPSTPRQSTPSTPRQSTLSTPRQSTPSTPRQSTLSTPRQSTLSTPRQSTPSTPRQSTPSTPRQMTTAIL